MSRHAWTALVAILGLSACGGGDDVEGAIDASTIDQGLPGTACNPLSPPGMQGCEVGKKCTWITVQEDPVETGQLRCVPNGTFPAGAVCAPSAGGVEDRCDVGLICAAGLCQDICGFGGGAEAACAAGHACARYAGLFVTEDGAALYGACTPTCDPLTQRRGPEERCPPGQGCYLLTGVTETVAVCARAGTVGHNQDLTGTPFANSCVPGAQPRQRATGSDIVQCGGLCRPIDVTSTMALGSEGGLAPDSCVVRWGAAAPDNGGLGESCRYWSAREPFAGLSPFSNTVGWCFKHVSFLFDPDGDGTLDTSFPRCAGVTTGDLIGPIGTPPHNDAQYFWCMAQVEPRAPSITIPQIRTDRIGAWR